MAFRNHPYLVFLELSVVLFVGATLGSDVIARMTVGGEGIAEALTQHVYYAAIQPIGTLSNRVRPALML